MDCKKVFNLLLLLILSTKPETIEEHGDVARQGGEIAYNARIELESKTGKKVISPLNAKQGIISNDNSLKNNKNIKQSEK